MPDNIIRTETAATVGLETSITTAALDEALAKAQGEIEVAGKDKVNPAFRSRYADLTSMWNAARPALAKHCISVTQWPLASTDNRLHIITRIAHKGEWMQARFSIPVDKGNAHGFGSATTYAKRFTLSAALGIVADDDDDGNAAAHKPGVPGSAGGGTDFRPDGPRRLPTSNWVDDAMNDGIVDQRRSKGALPPKPANGNGNGNAVKRAEWCAKAIEVFKTAQSKDDLTQWWKAERERLQVIEDAMPAEYERLIAAYDSAIERTARA